MPALLSYSVNCSLDQEGYDTVKEQHNLVMMGAAKVGKTAIVQQFLYDQFPSQYNATVEELHRGEYEVGGCSLTLDILDTSGAYAFPAMRRLAVTRGDAFILVYAINNSESFEEVCRLKENILEVRSSNVPIVVVGNKSDLAYCRMVRKEIAETVVTVDWEKGYIESSAKTGHNILAIFKEVLVQSHIHYALGPAVERRKQSLPIFPRESRLSSFAPKRNSCVVS